jgi:hypothetical protein
VMLARPLPNSVRYPPAIARQAMSSNHPASQGTQCGRPHSDAHADATTPVALAVYQYRRQGRGRTPAEITGAAGAARPGGAGTAGAGLVWRRRMSSRSRCPDPSPARPGEGRPGTQGVWPGPAPFRSGTRRAAARPRGGTGPWPGFQLDRVDSSHAGTPSCLRFLLGRRLPLSSRDVGIDGGADQGPASAGDPGPRGRDTRSGRQVVSTWMVTGTWLVMMSKTAERARDCSRSSRSCSAGASPLMVNRTVICW